MESVWFGSGEKHPNCVDRQAKSQTNISRRLRRLRVSTPANTLTGMPKKTRWRSCTRQCTESGTNGIRSFDSFGLAPFFPVEAQVEPPLFQQLLSQPRRGKRCLALVNWNSRKGECRHYFGKRSWCRPFGSCWASGRYEEWKIFTGNEIGCCWVTGLGQSWANGGTGENAVMLCSTDQFNFESYGEEGGLCVRGHNDRLKFMGNRTEQLENKNSLVAYEEAIVLLWKYCSRQRWRGCLCRVRRNGSVSEARERVSVSDHLKSLYEKYGYFAAYNGYFYWNENSTVDALFRTLRNGGNYQLRCGPYVIKNVRDLTGDGYDSGRKNFKPLLPCISSNMITTTFGMDAYAHSAWAEPSPSSSITLSCRLRTHL